MKIKLAALIITVFFTSSLFAKVSLPDILSDNMVLQQNSSVKLWGKADPGKTIKITSSWNKKGISTKADEQGRWLTNFNTPEASFSPQTITFSDGEKTILTNILIGEVWFASGQSNMEMPLNGFWNCPIQGANETIAKSGLRKGIRFVSTPKTAAYEPQETVFGKWMESNPTNAQWFSATAYHFAQTMQDALNVPIGIVVCSWGGSRVESWTNREILQTYPDVNLTQKGIESDQEWRRVLVMYNGMLKPLTNFTIKGFIWYQGESNVGKDKEYVQRFTNMVELWRKDWGLGNLPFYFVEIAPWIYGDGEAGISGALLREAQYKSQFVIPNSGMITTNDLVEEYEKTNIHPKNKTEVGKRLAYLALNETYGLKSIAARGPEYKSMEINEGKIVLSFNHAMEGFNRDSGIKSFEIAGSDNIFLPAEATIDHNNRTVIVWNENIKNPVSARYGFRNFLPGNLCNTRELPLVPFRTDNLD